MTSRLLLLLTALQPPAGAGMVAALSHPAPAIARVVRRHVAPDDVCAGSDAPKLGARRTLRAGAVTVTVSAGDVVVRRGSQTGRFDYEGALNPPWDACVLVVDAQTRSDSVYVLLRASGNSRAQPAEGECAAGDETKLLWYAISPRLGRRTEPVRRQSVLYESCLQQSYSDDPERFVDGRLHLATTSYLGGTSRQFALTYDRRAPERGIVVTGDAPDIMSQRRP